MWRMRFNIGRCKLIRMESAEEEAYLGVRIGTSLELSKQCTATVSPEILQMVNSYVPLTKENKFV